MASFSRRIVIFGALLALFIPPARAQRTPPVQVASGVSYELLARWDVERLNRILQIDTPRFAGTRVSYTPARNAVRLYRVSYNSVVPELANKPIVASGLLAIPDGRSSSFPMVSYQHGTVYGRHEVPSFPENSPETQLMIAQFAGQGYVLIGADYFGLGVSEGPEGYMVKGSHQQAGYDMLMASRSVLSQLKLSTDKLFLAGWSQGGFVTMALQQTLENAAVTARATATASAPLDVFALVVGAFSFPRDIDAPWLTSIIILSAFSYENYYGAPGLARSVIADAYYDVSRRAYERQPFDVADIPSDLHKLVRPEYFNPHYFAKSTYGRLMLASESYRWVFQSPVRNYYGEADEAVTVGIGRIAMTYAQSIGAGNPMVEAISTGPTSHRGTFATAVPLWKVWFDSR